MEVCAEVCVEVCMEVLCGIFVQKFAWNFCMEVCVEVCTGVPAGDKHPFKISAHGVIRVQGHIVRYIYILYLKYIINTCTYAFFVPRHNYNSCDI